MPAPLHGRKRSKCFSTEDHKERISTKTMKKTLFLLLLGILALPAGAVLKERNLQQSLSVLHVELRNAYVEQKLILQRYSATTQTQHKKMLETMKKSSQISLMLFSQTESNIFDLTYACNEATEQYRQFTRQRTPFKRINQNIINEVERYNGLINALEELPPALSRHKPAGPRMGPKDGKADTGKTPFMLDSAGQNDRAKCLMYAKALRNNILRLSEQIKEDSMSYQMTANQLEKLNSYAIQRYHDIQQNIFVNNNTNYLEILSRLKMYVLYAQRDFQDKYSTSGSYRNVNSEWRGPIVWGYILFVIVYLVLACVLSICIVNLLMRKWKRLQTTGIRQRKAAITLTCGVMIFALSIMTARVSLTHNFYVMASKLLVEFAWLLVAIFASLLIRLDGTQIKNGFRIYTPIVLMGLIIIVMRIVFIPNIIVSLLLFPTVLCFTVWQWFNMRHNQKHVPHSDSLYTGASLMVMVFSTIAAAMGYTLLAVEAFIWWLFQLTAIQSITCVYHLLNLYEGSILKKRLMGSGASMPVLASAATKHGEYITVTWFFDLVHKALVPVAGVYSVLYCIYLAADVFDLSETCISIFMTPFVDLDGVIQLSLFKMVVVAALFFIFKYVSYATKAFYRHIRLNSLKRKSGKKMIRANEVNLTLGYNLITILAWGSYLILATIILRIPKSGISIITAGLATGVGFAMKDLLNNFFYGISLMAGRLRVGDWIECDGVQGKVESISYQSTQIITTDDCVMSFLNETLFSKNFKNLTRNHSYELVKIPVGVAYGTNVNRVRELLISAVEALQSKDKYGRYVLEPKRGVSVVLSDFGDNSVDLIVVIRVLVVEKIGFMGRAKEVIYNTLTENNIEIPFPQRDVYIRQIAPTENAQATQAPSNAEK